MMNTRIDSDDVNYSRGLPNLPRPDLLTGRRDDYLKYRLPLFEASIKCDWGAAEAILDQRPDLVRHSITENGETALHVAASAKSPKHVWYFVTNLVRLMTPRDLELENENFNTAFHLAAAAGNLETIKIMVEKNRTLLEIPGGEGKMLPLYTAAMSGNYDVVKYLYEISNLRDDGWTHENRGLLLDKCVQNNMFDVALQIVKKYPELCRRGSVLGILAQKPDAFVERKPMHFIGIIRKIVRERGSEGREAPEGQALQLLRFILDDIVKLPKNEIDIILRSGTSHSHSFEALFTAAEMGNTIFLVELIRRFPDIMWKVNDKNQTIFHIAVENHHEDIYTMLYEIGYMKDWITSLDDENGNNMLHLVAKIAKKKKLEEVSGVMFQMQRELLWFQEVEFMVNPSCIERKNKDGLTPHELFTKEHEDLLAQSVSWVKETANQCMIVATLVATIAFAAAITVPGGYEQDTGIPIFYRDTAYTIFILLDAISLSTSSISLIFFIAILTSRFAECDFQEIVPKRFMFFLSTLILSVIAMILSFTLSFFVIYLKKPQYVWILIGISYITALPVMLFMLTQYSLLQIMFRWKYGSSLLFKPKKHALYYQNPML